MELTEKKNILVTGGAGFIGSFLCERLLKEGNRVICIDNFSTGHVRNIDPYLRNADFQFLRLDITEPFDLESFPELEAFKIKFVGIQEVYHLAAPTTIAKFKEFRIQTLLAHSVGTRNVLDVAVKYKAKALLASSSVVYGPRSADRLFFKESDQGIVDQLSERACYDEGKRFAETMFATYADVYGMEAKIARIFRTYGPRMMLFDGQEISDMVLAALNGEDMMMHGKADFSTSLVYVTDVVDGLIRLMKAEKGVGPVNIGSDEDVKLADVAEQIIAMTGSASKIGVGESVLFFTELGLPDITKAKERLGWLPVTRLEEGLQKSIEYIRANKILLTGE